MPAEPVADPKAIYETFLDTNFRSPDFAAKSRDDFGGPHSTNQNLRRRDRPDPNRDTRTADENNDYGLYWGKHNGKYVVAVKDLLSFRPKLLLRYDSLEELKKEWELD
jgi:hypothetical protein